MKRIYFVRHGESVANATQVHASLITPLTEKGHQQAKFIAARCAKLKAELLVSSTLTRAKQTSEYISQTTNLSPEYSDLFVESRGPSEHFDKSHEDLEAKEAYEQINKNYGNPEWRISDAENYEDHIHRAQAALKFLEQRSENDILVVTHGLFLKILTACVIFDQSPTSREIQQISKQMDTENTGLTIFRFDEQKNTWRIFVWNDHAHLAD